MNFDFSDDLKLLREQAQKFLAEKCPSSSVRKVLESDAPYDQALWQEMSAVTAFTFAAACASAAALLLRFWVFAGPEAYRPPQG